MIMLAALLLAASCTRSSDFSTPVSERSDADLRDQMVGQWIIEEPIILDNPGAKIRITDGIIVNGEDGISILNANMYILFDNEPKAYKFTMMSKREWGVQDGRFKETILDINFIAASEAPNIDALAQSMEAGNPAGRIMYSTFDKLSPKEVILRDTDNTALTFRFLRR